MSKHRSGFWTHDDEAVKDVGHLYYFAPTNRAAPPYRKQRHVNAIIDIAADGTLAGVELIDDMPPPPVAPSGSASLADWITYADKLEAALKLVCGQSSDQLMRMHAEQGLRLVRPI